MLTLTDVFTEPALSVVEPTPSPFVSPLPTPPAPDVEDTTWLARRPQPSAQTLTLAPEGGRLATRDNVVTLDCPPKTIDTPLELDVQVLVPENPYQANGEFRWLTLDVTPRDPARAVDGHLRFAQPVTLTFDLTGFPAWLQPYLVHQVDAECDTWEWLPAQYDPETQRLTGQVAAFSQVGVSGAAKFPDDGTHYLLTNLPTVSAFSGAATYNYTFPLPGGRAGLGPELSLTYNSGALNGVMGVVQSNYVGSAWNLGGMAAIVRSIKSRVAPVGGSAPLMNWEYSNDFTLLLGGASYHLFGPDKQGASGGCRYYAEDAPQLLVLRYTAAGDQNQYCGYGAAGSAGISNTSLEYWVVTTANGTQYRLGFTAEAEQLARMDNYNSANGYTLTGGYTGVCSGSWCAFPGYAGEALWRVPASWAVDRVSDVYSNTIFYGYTEEHRYISAVSLWWDSAHYPDWIRYTGTITAAPTAAGATLVDFIYEERPEANDNSCSTCEWHDDGEAAREYNMRDKYRLDRLRVCTQMAGTSCPDSSASRIEYDLDYEFVEEPWPGLEWIINTIPHENTRLTSLTQSGWNAQGQKVALPVTTFTYADYNQGDDSVDPTGGGNVGWKLQYPRLVAVNNGYGGQTTFTYNSVVYRGVYSWRVAQQNTSDGLGHSAGTAYTYTAPCFSGYENNCRRSGLEDPTYALIGHQATAVAVYDYNSALLNTTCNTFITTTNVNRGKTAQTQTSNASGVLQQQQDTTWGVAANVSTTFGYADWVTTTQYFGGATTRTAVDYTYDEYGNVTAEYQYGGTGVFGDERSIHRRYYANTTTWIVSNVARESIYAGIRSDDDNTSYLKSRTRYRYDSQSCWNLPPLAKGALTAVDRWFGPRGGTEGNCYQPDYDSTTYTYDVRGNVTAVTDPRGNTTTTTYETTYRQFPIQVCSGGLCTKTYYYNFYLDQTITGGYGLFGQVQATRDANDVSTGYSYDAFGRPVGEARPGDSLTSPTHRYVYHEPLSAPGVSNPGFENRVSGPWIEYDSYNNQTYSQDATQAYAGSNSLKIVTTGTAGHWVGQYLDGWQVERTYQIRAYVKTATSGKLCLQFSALDGHEVQAACRVATGAWDLLIGTVTVPTNATRFLLLLRTPQVGTVYVDEVYVTALYAVSAYAKEDAAGNTLWQRQVYDGLGRVLQTQAEYNGALATVVDQRYDARGLVVAQSVPYTATSSVDAPWYVAPAAPAQTLTQYDALGRANQSTAPDGSLGYLRYYGRQTATLDALGRLSIAKTDAYGQLAEVREYTGTYTPTLNWTALEQPGNYYARTRYAYDTLGNLTTVTDTLGNITTMTYDKLSRKTDMYDPDMGHWVYSYDNAGNLTTQTDAKGQVVWFGYDALNRLVQKRVGSSTGAILASYTYDCGGAACPTGNSGKGRRTGMSDASGGSATWIYDTRGRVTQETKTINGGGSFSTGYTYDPMDRVVTTTYPDNEVVRNTYNAAGQPATLRSDTYGYNYVSSASYTAPGAMAAMTYGNGLTTNYDYYDDPGEALSFRLQRVQVGPAGSLLNLSYTYDSVGNVVTITDSKNSGQVQNFTYDALDRLTHAWTTGGGNGAYDWTYAYDQIGNLDWRKEGSTTFDYNYPTVPNSPRPHAVTSVSGKNWSYTYDANGSMLTRVENGVSYTQGWNQENRLQTVSGNSTTTTFTYDGDGNRVKKVEGGVTTYYVGGYYEKQGSTITKYYYAGGQRIAMRKGGVVYYLHGDHLGSTSLTTSASGAEVARQLYYPYGEARWYSGTLPTDYTFTGQRNESSFKLMDYNARYYDPSLNRFIQADTMVPSPANPQSLNRYSYVLNSPLRYTDPTGHFTDDELAALLGDNWEELMKLWEEYDPYWYHILRYILEGGYTMTASEAYLPGLNTGGWSNTGTERWFITFAGSGKDIQAFEYVMNEKSGRMIQQQSQGKLVDWQGKGAYAITGPGDVGDIGSAALFKQFMEYGPCGLGTGVPQPQFDYSSDNPSLKGWNLVQMSLGRFQYKGAATEFVTWMGGTPSWGDGMEMAVDVGLFLVRPELGLIKFAADVIVSYNAMASDTNAYKTVKYPLPR